MSVFDLQALGEMAAEIRDPVRGDLMLLGEEHGVPLEDAARGSYDEGVEVSFSELDAGNLRVWEPPNAKEQYVIGADVSQGLSRSDASASAIGNPSCFGLCDFLCILQVLRAFNSWEFMESGIEFIVLFPIFGFLIAVFTRFLAEQFRALSSIANNTRKN
jgi:hypothetical protein